ncbi:MAG: adenylate kinase [Nitrososphaerales archaeon]
MGEAKRAIVVGIPGVGKSTIVNKTVELLKKQGISSKYVIFGSVMFDEATKLGLARHRDDMRKLSVKEQTKLQVLAASNIMNMSGDVIIVDTHLFIHTSEGYWPGIPESVLKALSPTHLVCLEASPNEIIDRRTRDISRFRDPITEDEINRDLQVSRSMLSTLAILSGAPMLVTLNGEGKADEAARNVVRGLGINIG